MRRSVGWVRNSCRSSSCRSGRRRLLILPKMELIGGGGGGWIVVWILRMLPSLLPVILMLPLVSMMQQRSPSPSAAAGAAAALAYSQHTARISSSNRIVRRECAVSMATTARALARTSPAEGDGRAEQQQQQQEQEQQHSQVQTSRGRRPPHSSSSSSSSAFGQRHHRTRPPSFQNHRKRKRARLASIVRSAEALLVPRVRGGDGGDNDNDGGEDGGGGGGGMHPLAACLRQLLQASTQAQVVEAGANIERLLFGGEDDDEEEEGPVAASYGLRVLDLVLRGVALTGLVPLSARLWDRVVQLAIQQKKKEEEEEEQLPLAWAGPSLEAESSTAAAAAAASSVRVSDGPIPSYPTQEVVCHTFRKAGRLALLRHVLHSLQELADNTNSSSRGGCGCGPVMSPVAFNMVVAAHCDPVLQATRRGMRAPPTKAAVVADPRPDGHGLDGAYRILRAGVHSAGLVDADAVAFATVLQACARAGNATLARQVWDDMTIKAPDGLTPNVVAHNARLQLALQHPSSESQASRDKAALAVWRELIEAVQPDQYSIDWVVMPLLRAGREATLWIILNHFVAENSQPAASLAFTAFLATIVRSGDVRAARRVFNKYLLPSLSPVVSGPVNSIRLVRPTTRHFNVLLSGYQDQHYHQARAREAKHRAAATAPGSGKEATAELEAASDAPSSPREEAIWLYRLMQTTQDCQPNEITRTILLSMSTSSEEIVSLVSDELEFHEERTTGRPQVHGSVLRAAIMAAGKVGDASLAAWLHAALEAAAVTPKEEGSARTWNVLVGALANADAVAYYNGDVECSTVDVVACSQRTIPDGFHDYLSRIPQGGRRDTSPFPMPSSQTYCLIASVFQRRCPSADLALSLFRNATCSHGVPADGRFVNAVLRCFGSDLERALEAWKGEIRPATLAHDARYRSSPSAKQSGVTKKKQKPVGGASSSGKSLTAAYHGLLYVCGRAAAPQMALRVVYAMRRDGLEPDETALNCYRSGKNDQTQIQELLARDGSQRPNVADEAAAPERTVGRATLALQRIKDTLLGKDRNPYESLLFVECTQYNQNDRRRIGEQRVRIIV